MNISCPICSDLVEQTENLLATKCGHLFHANCLEEWLQRSETCPQCRNAVTNGCTFKLFPNSTDESSTEVTALQESLDDTLKELEKSQNEKDVMETYISELSDKYAELRGLQNERERQIRNMTIENETLKKKQVKSDEEILIEYISELDERNLEVTRLKHQLDHKEIEIQRLKMEALFLKKNATYLYKEQELRKLLT